MSNHLFITKLFNRPLVDWVTLVVISIPLLVVILVPNYRYSVGGPDVAFWEAPVFFDAARSFARYGPLDGMYSTYLQCGTYYWWYPNFNPIYPLYFNWVGPDESIFNTVERLNFITALHLSLLSLATIMFTRALGGRKWAAIAAGLAMPWAPGTPLDAVMCASYPWLVFMMFSFLSITRNPRKLWPHLLLGTSVAAVVLAFPAQHLVFAFTSFVLFWLAWFVVSMYHSSLKSTISSLFPIIIRSPISAILLASTCGYFILNIIDFHQNSIRWLGEGFGAITGGDKIPKKALAKYGMEIADSISLFFYMPETTRVIGNLFVGPILFLGILVSVILKPSSRTVPFIVITIVSFVLCFSITAGNVTFYIPIINKVREIGWWSCLMAITAIPLGFLGLDKSLAWISAARGRKLRFAPVAVIAFAALFFLPQSSIASALAIASIVIAILMYAAKKSLRSSMTFFTIAAVSITAIFLEIRKHPTSDQHYIYSQDFMNIYSDAQEVKEKIPNYDIGSRIMIASDYRYTKELSTVLSTMGFRVVQTFGHPLELNKFKKLFNPTNEDADSLGVKWIVHGEKFNIDMKPTGLSIENRPNSKTYAYLSYSDGKTTDIPGTSPEISVFTFQNASLSTLNINEFHRFNCRVLIDGAPVQTMPNELLQLSTVGIQPGLHVVEIER